MAQLITFPVAKQTLEKDQIVFTNTKMKPIKVLCPMSQPGFNLQAEEPY